MKIAVTGATGFIGRYIVDQLADANHELKCWYRPTSDLMGLEQLEIQWVEGSLSDKQSMGILVGDCDAVVHAALWRPGKSFRGGEGNVAQFAAVNIIGTLNLIQAAIDAGVPRFIFISTCAVHEKILDDRPLDEAHPLWATSHYGAHKAAIEKFVHSYGLGQGYNICALRPTGVYGLNNPIQNSKWFDLISDVALGRDVEVSGGGKEVHASDVANAVGILLAADGISGEAYNCYDIYVSQSQVAEIAKQLSGSESNISGQRSSPKHQIETAKIKSLGMRFGGEPLLQQTIGQIIQQLQKTPT